MLNACLPGPLFISVQIGGAGAYAGLLRNRECTPLSPDRLLQEVSDVVAQCPGLIGIGFYGDRLADPAVRSFAADCCQRGVKIGLDLAPCDEDWEVFLANAAYVDTLRIVLGPDEWPTARPSARQVCVDRALDRASAGETVRCGKVVVAAVGPRNAGEVLRFGTHIVSRGFRVNPLPMSCVSAPYGLSRAEFRVFLGQLSELERRFPKDVYTDAPVGFASLAKPCICPALRLAVDVAGDGTLRACKFSPAPLGATSDLRRHWTALGDVWRQCASCVGCAAWARCGGGCIANKASPEARDIYCMNETGKGACSDECN